MSTATLHIEKKKTLVPQLRFREFDGEWKDEKLLKHVHSISSGKIKPSDEGEFLVYGSTGIIGKSNIYTHEGDYILVARVGANAGQINRAKGKYAVTDNTLIVDLKEDVSVSFCESFLTKFNLNKLIFGSGQPLITGGLLKAIDFIFPTLPEQQKIASFLSAVDEKIQQLSRKKELLEQYKKGVMQQLFSGKLRFKDENGNDYADWKIIKVQELINEKAIISLLDGNHGALYPKSEEFAEDGIPYVAANNLVNGQVKFSECKYLPVERAKKFKKGIAKNGDVLFAHNATVGPTALLKTELDFIILSTTVTYYRCDLNVLSNTYLLHYFNSDNFISQYTKVMSQSTRNQVPITMQKKFNIDFPCLEEQQKIANFLSSVDTKIESTNQQINQTQSFKKGLLQQLFV